MSGRCWLITKGVYSDYRVVAVVTDPAIAEQFSAWRATQTAELDDLDIGEAVIWDGDSEALQHILAIPAGDVYRMFFDRSTHEFVELVPWRGEWRWGSTSGTEPYVDADEVGRCGLWDEYKGKQWDFCVVAASDFDHALKVAKDTYIMWLASGAVEEDDHE